MSKRVESLPIWDISSLIWSGSPCAVELNYILVYTLIVCHRQAAELMLCITNGVVRTEVCPEFLNELGVAVHPEGTESGG